MRCWVADAQRAEAQCARLFSATAAALPHVGAPGGEVWETVLKNL
jgi:hypothetical protein